VCARARARAHTHTHITCLLKTFLNSFKNGFFNIFLENPNTKIDYN